MRFTKGGFTMTAFYMVGTFTMSGVRYEDGWIVRGWVDGKQIVMSDEQFQTIFRNREAA